MVTLLSFRAECEHDVQEILQAARAAGLEVVITQYNPDATGFPDVEVELEVSASLEDFKTTFEDIDDIHVALETMRAVPLSQNSLKRT